ncbi:MAG TPA: superoxide dismutase [Spirochaetales bacterium]|nr:superoxide dismutase [Spirochaetales bacterium]
MPFTLPDLPYSYDALAPAIDEETMRLHHDKHHQAYVDNLNKAVAGTEYSEWKIEALLRELGSLPESIRTAVRNNGGGHANHSLFWTLLSPTGGGKPSGALGAAIDRELGGFDSFKAELTKAAMSRFGSGWAWLVLTPGGKLAVSSTPNQDSPLSDGHAPIVGIDVWEHAYYLTYRNRRAEWVDAFFRLIDWKAAGRIYENAIK